MAVASMFYVVYPLKQFRRRTCRRIPLLYHKRNALKVERVVYENRYRAGHGEPKAVEELVGSLLGFVVDSEVDLCHGMVSPLCEYDSKWMIAMSSECYTFEELKS